MVRFARSHEDLSTRAKRGMIRETRHLIGPSVVSCFGTDGKRGSLWGVGRRGRGRLSEGCRLGILYGSEEGAMDCVLCGVCRVVVVVLFVVAFVIFVR